MISSRTVLISSSLRLSPRSVAPGLSFARAPRAAARFSFYRSARFISSSRHLILLSCRFYRYTVGACHIHGEGLAAAGQATGAAACGLFFSLVHRFPQLIIIRPVIRVSSSGRRLIVPSPPWGSALVPHHLIRSAHLTRPQLPHLTMEREAAWKRSPSFKQATTAWRPSRLIVSSHHLIPSVMERLVPPSRLMRLGRASRPHIPGHQRGRGGRSKQANTQNRDEKPGSKTGRRTERGRQDNGKRKNGTRTMASKAGEGATGTCGNHAQEQNAPHFFSPDPLAAGSHLFAGLN